ncbi:MAG: DUF3078 domain-containing protein [Candidatus Cloacimonetes bacterium]|nr:DUF3078 domain-containing protein [Candidatus Cloacimonadota bacterium]
MKKLVIILVMVLACNIIFAEDWNMEADANLNLNQSSYSENWEGSEVGNITWAFNANLFVEKQFSPIFLNKNTLKLAYGQTHSQDQTTKDWQKPLKSTDLIDFETIGLFTLGLFADPFVSGRLETQFEDGEKNFNPINLTESFGAAKILYKKDKTELSTRIGAAFKQHLNSYSGIDNTQDGGIELVTNFKSPFASDMISLDTRLSVFKALYYSEEDDAPNDYWKQPDVDWEATFTANVTKYIMVNLYTQLLYDKQIDLAGRFKQTLSLGLTYKFL